MSKLLIRVLSVFHPWLNLCSNCRLGDENAREVWLKIRFESFRSDTVAKF